jgi:hypothetical protein
MMIIIIIIIIIIIYYYYYYYNSVQTGSGSHPASYPVGARDNSLGVKRKGSEADHPFPSSAKVKDCGIIRPLLISLHGAMLNQLNTRIALRFYI